MVALILFVCFFYWVVAAFFDSIFSFFPSSFLLELFTPAPEQLAARLAGLSAIMLLGGILMAVFRKDYSSGKGHKKGLKPSFPPEGGIELREQKEMPLVVKEPDRLYKDIIDNIGIGIALISSDARRIYMNKQMQEWFPSKEASQQSICHDIFGNFSPEKCSQCPPCNTLRDGRAHSSLLKTLHNGKTAVYKVFAFPIKENGAVIGAIEMVEDYTRINQQEEQIRRNYLVQAVMNSLLRFSLENISLEGFLDCALNIILSTPWFSSASMGAVYLVEEDPDVLVLRVNNNLPKDIANRYSRIPFGQGVCGQAASSGILQYQAARDGLRSGKRRDMYSYGHYCVPVAYLDRIVGVIDVYLYPEHQPNKREEEFLNAAANTVAGVIQRKRNERRVAKINEGFISLGADPLHNIQQLVNLCRAILEADFVVYHRSGQEDMIAFYAAHPRFFNGNRGQIESYCSLSSTIIASQSQEELFVLDNIVQFFPQQPDYAINKIDFKICMGQAVKNRGQAIGTICAFYRRSFSPGNDDKKFLGIIASALATEQERINANQQLRRAYDELKKTQDSLIQTEKLAALGRFSSGIAHEVKNPLGIVLGGIEFLEQKFTTKDKEAILAAKKIKEATLRADKILRNLLKFAMPSELKTESIRVKELVNDTISFFKYRASLVNVDIITDFPREDIWVSADINQMQQVLFNLLMNASEAISERGQIKVSVYEISPDEAEGRKAACAIEISDTGSGIAQEHIPKLFEPFFTTKRDKKGTGLGLAISKMIVENHGGSLTINSVLSKGTTVTLSLPLANKIPNGKS